MEDTGANRPPATTTTTLAFRYPVSRRRVLEAIQAEKGHAQLSDTLRDAVDAYIEQHVRRPRAA